MNKNWREVLEASNKELKSKLKAEIIVEKYTDMYDNTNGCYNVSIKYKDGEVEEFTENTPEDKLWFWIDRTAKIALNRARRYVVTSTFTTVLPDYAVFDGDTEVKIYESVEDAKEHFRDCADAEIDYREENGDKYEIVHDEEFYFQINWCDGDCKSFVQIHEVYV